jgi:transcriptional regulator with XRE-family HTH domain
MKRTTTGTKKQPNSQICLVLKEIREEAKLSVRQVASELDMASSTYATYEDRFKKQFLPMSLVKRLRPIFAKRGIDEARIRSLAGSVDDDAQFSLSLPMEFQGLPAPELIKEIDTSVSAGPGSLPAVEHRDAIRQIWGIPGDYIRSEMLSTPEHVLVVAVTGDSMEPTLRPAERVFVNTADRKPSPPGIFVMWDGISNIIKRIEFIHGSDPPRVRVISDNQYHKEYEILLDDNTIVGRVIGSVRRL